MQERKYDEAIVKKRIKQLLKETHTTQTKLCDSIGVDYAYFTKALNFKQGIGFGINTVINVADYFDVSVDYLLGRTGVRKIGN